MAKTTVASLLEALRQEVLKAALAASPEPGQIILAPRAGHVGFRFDEIAGHRVVAGYDADYSSVLRLQTPTGPDGRYPDLRPGVWYGSESRRDAQGREWTRSIPAMVMDDFGDLVEVPQ